jgi:hypothetical protein
MAADARFFDSWLSMVLNAVVLTWFAFFALGLSAFMGVSMFKAIQDGGGFLGGTFNVLGEATRYCVLMILMAIICFQAPSLASALTGGAAVQQGIQMIQNAMMVSGLRSASAARGGAAAAAVAWYALAPACRTPRAKPRHRPHRPQAASPERWPPAPQRSLARDTARRAPPPTGSPPCAAGPDLQPPRSPTMRFRLSKLAAAACLGRRARHHAARARASRSSMSPT